MSGLLWYDRYEVQRVKPWCRNSSMGWRNPAVSSGGGGRVKVFIRLTFQNTIPQSLQEQLTKATVSDTRSFDRNRFILIATDKQLVPAWRVRSWRREMTTKTELSEESPSPHHWSLSVTYHVKCVGMMVDTLWAASKLCVTTDPKIQCKK